MACLSRSFDHKARFQCCRLWLITVRTWTQWLLWPWSFACKVRLGGQGHNITCKKGHFLEFFITDVQHKAGYTQTEINAVQDDFRRISHWNQASKCIGWQVTSLEVTWLSHSRFDSREMMHWCNETALCTGCCGSNWGSTRSKEQYQVPQGFGTDPTDGKLHELWLQKCTVPGLWNELPHKGERFAASFGTSSSRQGEALCYPCLFTSCSQLTSTKSADNKTNLMHYLVDTIQNKFPDLRTFDEELIHVEQAARGMETAYCHQLTDADDISLTTSSLFFSVGRGAAKECSFHGQILEAVGNWHEKCTAGQDGFAQWPVCPSDENILLLTCSAISFYSSAF